MRATRRLLAEVARSKPSGQFLTPHTPTGLTGLLTHPFPRPTLISVFNQTLAKLQALPTNSLYRQSVEGLTKHRLAIVEAQVPEGFKEWEQRIAELVKQHPELAEGRNVQLVTGQQYFMSQETHNKFDDRGMEAEWDAEVEPDVERGEGPRTARERKYEASEVGEGIVAKEIQSHLPTVPNEPPLTTAQISTIEEQVAAGLIEEVIQVAEAELALVDVMAEHKVWEELEEAPVQGQWSYFARVQPGVGTTQAPPKA